MAVDPQDLFAAFIVVATMLLVGFPVHEALHAWTAYRLGDNTARFMGRVSLDPRVHFDPLGGGILAVTAIFSSIGAGGLLFGWAKPTPVNTWNLRYGHRGHGLVAFAGPASNLVVAILVAIPLRLVLEVDDLGRMVADSELLLLFFRAGELLLNLNILLFIFNLVPIPPLDGWAVVQGIVPRDVADRMDQLTAQYANMIPIVFLGFILVLFLTGGALLGPLIFGIRDVLLGL
jgi:Zn-dependent protease